MNEGYSEQQREHERTALWTAVKDGDHAKVCRVLRTGLNPNFLRRNNTGDPHLEPTPDSPLALAVAYPYPDPSGKECMKTILSLLEAGARPDNTTMLLMWRQLQYSNADFAAVLLARHHGKVSSQVVAHNFVHGCLYVHNDVALCNFLDALKLYGPSTEEWRPLVVCGNEFRPSQGILVWLMTKGSYKHAKTSKQACEKMIFALDSAAPQRLCLRLFRLMGLEKAAVVHIALECGLHPPESDDVIKLARSFSKDYGEWWEERL